MKNRCFIQKLDANGNFIWAKQMGQTGYAESKSTTVEVIFAALVCVKLAFANEIMYFGLIDNRLSSSYYQKTP